MPRDMVITWVGDVGLSSFERARTDIDRVLDLGGAERLVIDFSAAAAIEPVAVGLLVHALARGAEYGITVLLRAVPPETKRLLATIGLTRMFDFEGSEPGEISIENLPARTSMPAEPDEHLDKIVELTRALLGVPTALVTLVDQVQQVFPGAVGLPDPWQGLRSTPLSHSFCKHVVNRGAPFVVSDATVHPLLADSPAITDLNVVAYAGTPLVDEEGRVVGALCAIDSVPRSWTADELEILTGLAAACSAALHRSARTDPPVGSATE